MSILQLRRYLSKTQAAATYLPLAGGTMTGPLTVSQTAGIVGTTTNNNATAGSVGEYVTASATSVAISNGVATNITSISLTAGDWDVSGNINFACSAANMTNIQAGISTTSASLPAGPAGYAVVVSGAAGGSLFSNFSHHLSPIRQSLAAPATVYLVGYAAFGAGTGTASGFIRARRMR